MTIREAGKGVVTSGRGTYNIGFNDGDETQFDVQNLEELQECWSEFCKEEKVAPAVKRTAGHWRKKKVAGRTADQV